MPLDFELIDRSDPSNTNVYIGNISPDTSEAELAEHFSGGGPVGQCIGREKGRGICCSAADVSLSL
jgi:RNA recognition motif-containing protein